MPAIKIGWGSMLLALGIILVILPTNVSAFGAGNIPSISQVEGKNFRHGDIEDVLSSIAFLKGKKWTSMLIKRTYFGNWLRDYSQAVDIGSLKGANSETIRVLVWVLSFMAFGYATAEFEVTRERLGVYRPEEHIDNPLGYGEGIDARDLDSRLRGPVDPVEVEIDPRTGMKNYIANERGSWATSSGYLRFSFARSIHYGRVYTHGSHGSRGKEEDLCEALRCLGQALHCMEDFSAHSNYCELALRELGYHDVFAHCGRRSEITLGGKRVFPLVTGTFGEVDFLHSVLGEATDHFTQSEVDEMNAALIEAEKLTQGTTASRGFGFGSGSGSDGLEIIGLLSQIPGIGGDMAGQARDLKASSDAREHENEYQTTRDSSNQIPGMSPNFDPVETARKIYPILEFRDRVVKNISSIISKIPGLEKLLDHIGETLTAFVLGLLAPFVRPIIEQISKTLKDGSSTVIGASSKSQFVVWDDKYSTDPTHSMLSKDHFTNILNGCAGEVASEIVKYTVPRILYAWENPGVPVDEVVDDVLRAFHHPAIRDDNIEIQRIMFKTVRNWSRHYSRRDQLNHLLSSQSVKEGKNHILKGDKTGHGHSHGHSHGGGSAGVGRMWDAVQDLGHGKVAGSLWSQVKTRSVDSESGPSVEPSQSEKYDYHQNPNYWDDPTDPGPSRPSSRNPNYGYTERPSSPPTGGEGGYSTLGHSHPQPHYAAHEPMQGHYNQPHHAQYGQLQSFPYPGSAQGYSGPGYGAPPLQYGAQSEPPPPGASQYGPPPPGNTPQYGPPGGYQPPYPPSGGGYGGYPGNAPYPH